MTEERDSGSLHPRSQRRDHFRLERRPRLARDEKVHTIALMHEAELDRVGQFQRSLHGEGSIEGGG